MKLNDNVYTCLKWLAIIILPASATFVKTVFPVWNLPYAEAIATTLTAFATLIGAVIGISTINYYAQDVEDTTDSEAKG